LLPIRNDVALGASAPKRLLSAAQFLGSISVATYQQDDLALAALFYPFEVGQLRWPEDGAVLFMGAREGLPLREHKRDGLVFEQSFKPSHDAVSAAGIAEAEPSDADYAMILMLPPRQKDYARAQYVRALQRLRPGGVLVLSQANADGAKSCQTDLQRLVGSLSALSKHKSRVMWTAAGPAFDAEQARLWLRADEPREIVDSRFRSRPGVFAWDRIDPASRLLAEHLPADLTGCAADLGAGYGYLTSELLSRCANVTAVDLYEADGRALALARENLAEAGASRELEFHWQDVGAGLEQRYDCIVCNPPFHAQQGQSRPDIGRQFLLSAANALLPGGRLWFVANRHLPYEECLSEGFGEVRQVVQSGAYKVIEALRDEPRSDNRGARSGTLEHLIKRRRR